MMARTASAPLAKLAEAGLTEGRRRRRYFTLADDEIGAVLDAERTVILLSLFRVWGFGDTVKKGER